MEFRKSSRAVLAVLIVAGACFSAPASARHDRHVARDILLAPLLLPAAIIAASSPPVVYHETHYVGSNYRGGHHGYAPRYDSRRHGGYRSHGGHGGGYGRHGHRHYR